jgi:hypothetical protein
MSRRKTTDESRHKVLIREPFKYASTGRLFV